MQRRYTLEFKRFNSAIAELKRRKRNWFWGIPFPYRVRTECRTSNFTEFRRRPDLPRNSVVALPRVRPESMADGMARWAVRVRGHCSGVFGKTVLLSIGQLTFDFAETETRHSGAELRSRKCSCVHGDIEIPRIVLLIVYDSCCPLLHYTQGLRAIDFEVQVANGIASIPWLIRV